MKETNLTEAVNEVIALKLKAADEYIATNITPIINSLGNPEKLIGVPWDMWTDQHKTILYSIYGDTLQDYIAKKAIAQMRALEAEVI